VATVVKEKPSSDLTARAKYLLKIRRRRGRYLFQLYDRLAPAPVLEFTLGDWWPAVAYLSFDPKYARGEDYEVVSEGGRPVEIAFTNPDCGHRAVVYLLSILGVDGDLEWVDRMKHVVAEMPIEAVWFWFGTACDWYTSPGIGSKRWQTLMRVARSIRTLYVG